MCHHAKWCANRSNRCTYFSILGFFIMSSSTISDFFINFKFLQYERSSGSTCVTVKKFLQNCWKSGWDMAIFWIFKLAAVYDNIFLAVWQWACKQANAETTGRWRIWALCLRCEDRGAKRWTASKLASALETSNLVGRLMVTNANHTWKGLIRSREPFKFWWAPTISLERLIVWDTANLDRR